MNSMQDNIKT